MIAMETNAGKWITEQPGYNMPALLFYITACHAKMTDFRVKTEARGADLLS